MEIKPGTLWSCCINLYAHAISLSAQIVKLLAFGLLKESNLDSGDYSMIFLFNNSDQSGA